MSAIPSYFTDFLSKVRLTSAQQGSCREKQQLLRALLKEDADFSRITVDTFLQGSYKRYTAVRPLLEQDHVDVDLVLVTTLDPEENTPQQVVARLEPFLNRNFEGAWEVNDRSITISFSDSPVTLDLVVTAAPSKIVRESIQKSYDGALTLSERQLGDVPDLSTLRQTLEKVLAAETWRNDFLLIPDRNLSGWDRTNPLEQIAWAQAKNARTGGEYVDVVKSVKWWRRRHAVPKYPKGYPLEHLLGDMCPDGIETVGEGLVLGLEGIVDRCDPAALPGGKPTLFDRGLPDNDVFERVTASDYGAFYGMVLDAAQLARRAYDAVTVKGSATLFRELLGPEFPVPDEDGFTKRSQVSSVGTSTRYGY